MTPGEILLRLEFRALNARAARGILVMGHMRFPAACGRSGRGALKREGDGLSPRGSFALEAVLYRSDRIRPPSTLLPRLALHSDWAWCEEPSDRNYNRRVAAPRAPGHDRLKRADHLYDIVVLTSHNARPRIRGRGSAIFFHLAREGYAPTAGCIAVSIHAMRIILARCGRRTRLVIG